MKKIRIMVWLSLFALLSGLSFTTGVVRCVAALQELDEDLQSLDVFSDVYRVVRSQYVAPEDASAEALLRGAIQGMLNSLDPFSQYFPPREYKEFQDQTKGQFGGLGIRIQVAQDGWLSGWLTVVEPLPNTPAESTTTEFEGKSLVGLEAGDKIIEIEGESTRNIPINNAIDKLKGAVGTDVTIKIARRTEGRVITPEFRITRDLIKVPAVNPAEDVRIIDGTIGYIRLREFTQEAAQEVTRWLKELEQRGVKGLVLDLRSNTGGLLPVAVDVCEQFLPRDQLVVAIVERNKKRDEYSCRDDEYSTVPLAVLVNQQSASASEIVAGALQDTQRAIIIGPRGHNTYGKGSVQNVINLPDGSGLKLTTARYFTPSGRSIHEKGITPDVFVDVDEQHWLTLQIEKKVGYLPADRLRGRLPRKDGDVTGFEDEFTMEDTTASSQENVSLPIGATTEQAVSQPDKPSIDEILAEADKPDKAEDKQVYDKELLMAVQMLRGMGQPKVGQLAPGRDVAAMAHGQTGQ